MRKETLFAVRENSKIARDIYRMVLEGDTSAISAPGQFVNVQIDGLFLRRPISVCDVEAPVSYTHLDVYKRQPLWWGIRRSSQTLPIQIRWWS